MNECFTHTVYMLPIFKLSTIECYSLEKKKYKMGCLLERHKKVILVFAKTKTNKTK